MYCKILPYEKSHPQRIADLAALLRYLFIGRAGESNRNHVSRLGAAPIAFRLIQRVSPFGDTCRDAAYDLAQQLFEHARCAPIKGSLPFEVYKHLVISFPLGPVNCNFKDSPKARLVRPTGSESFATLRTARELLDAMGISEALPHIIVVHNDREHTHAHVVVGMYARNIDGAEIFKKLKPRIIRYIAASIYDAHQWIFPYRRMKDWYEAKSAPSIPRK